MRWSPVSGAELLEQAARDGIDISYVLRRPDVATGLIVEVLDSHAHWRHLQDLPSPRC
ncbi:hypothetical protein [Actinoplanes italicus]|uniref:Uncharacterized protein n=1 Tax=Actinoplanes italicus TaxID=113567 RepID=A0A2T0JYT5_9ACTN|nr:hypothetical protein [Actinoplanes italicus]PRX13859.1 hypothetical protein CLV67_12448 [Actinoplanes italicus]